MKSHFHPKTYWLMIGLIFLLILSGCQTTAPKSEAPPPQTPPPPQLPAQPSGEPAPSPKDVAPLPLPLPPVKALPPDETYFTHTVKWSGETLFIIAAWYTGNRENWKALAEAMMQANPNANIHRIFIGNKVLIPESLLKTRDPMPKEFVDNFYQKPKAEKAPPKPTPSQTEEEEPKLFGPKKLPKK
jgi:Tfp pilus assembly protein FimV